MAEISGGNYNTTFPKDPNEGNSVKLTSKWGGLELGGKNALDIFLFITMLGLIGFTAWEHTQRSNEHDTLDCRLKLTLYMQSVSPDKPLDWRRVPSDLYPCIPRFIIERDQPRQ